MNVHEEVEYTDFREEPKQDIVENETEYKVESLIPTVDEMVQNGIDETIATAFLSGDYEALKTSIDKFITEEIEKRITTNIPKTKQIDDFTSQLTSFESMGYKERLELLKKNPRLYKELTNKIV